MKKKLLITMGDSVTEGVGCYDYSKMSNPNVTYFELPENEGTYQLNRFHELGWPNRLGKKLNYDKVINIGWGGSGQSAHVKLFFEKIIENNFSDYEVLVVWLMSDPSRFSFYSFGRISQFHPSMYSKNGHEIELAYLKDIGDVENDSILETIFYLKCIEQICENNNFKLLVTSWERFSVNKIFEKYPSKYEMKSSDGKQISSVFFDNDELRSKVCFHPNEKGYETIAQNMFNSIKKYNPHLINKNDVEKFEWEWDGEPKNWNVII